mgnify:CR=1 FL=1
MYWIGKIIGAILHPILWIFFLLLTAVLIKNEQAKTHPRQKIAIFGMVRLFGLLEKDSASNRMNPRQRTRISSVMGGNMVN